tara:strand:- start:51 stop:182 length:132 start_codon:yes stop_codon:yes gene_type:complete
VERRRRWKKRWKKRRVGKRKRKGISLARTAQTGHGAWNETSDT